MYISVHTFATAVGTSRSLKALHELQHQIESLRAHVAAVGADHPDIVDITSSIADSLTDAWGDSGADEYIIGADKALIHWDS